MDLGRESSYPTPFANSPFLPLLLMSLMQQKIAPHTTDKLKTEYDFIIVGAGTAGSVLGGRLSEVPCASILLLEAGGPPPLLADVPILAADFWDSDIGWGYKTQPQKHTAKAMVDQRVPFASGKTLGGSSVLNLMLYLRGNKRNYDEWAAGGAVGWSYSDVLPYFLKLENNTDPDHLADGYHVVGGPVTVSKQEYEPEILSPVREAVEEMGYGEVDANAANQTGFYDAQVNVRNGQRCSSSKAYLIPAENRTNLDIVSGAFVRKVLIEDGRAIGVVFEREGVTFEVRARKEVILSAGSVNSAQLLMLSGIGPKQQLEKFGIPVLADLPVGENLQDHCGVNLYFEADSSIPNKEQKMKNATVIQDYIKNRKGLLSTPGVNPLVHLPRASNPERDLPDFQLAFMEAAAPTPNPHQGIKPQVIEEYFGPHRNSSLFLCLAVILRPRSRGTVRLQSRDPRHPPLIDPNYLAEEGDVQHMLEALRACDAIGRSNPLKRIGSKPLGPFPGCEGGDDFECLARSTVDSIHHPCGTAKMGHPADPTTVVDPRLRVKGVEGLRVVDASVIPTIPSGNINIPVTMIAEKAADIIKGTLDCHTQVPAA